MKTHSYFSKWRCKCSFSFLQLIQNPCNTCSFAQHPRLFDAAAKVESVKILHHFTNDFHSSGADRCDILQQSSSPFWKAFKVHILVFQLESLACLCLLPVQFTLVRTLVHNTLLCWCHKCWPHLAVLKNYLRNKSYFYKYRQHSLRYNLKVFTSNVHIDILLNYHEGIDIRLCQVESKLRWDLSAEVLTSSFNKFWLFLLQKKKTLEHQ